MSELLDISKIRRAWNKYTSASPDRWTPENPALGQCAVTALVVQDLLGGRLLRAKVNGESHYWNLLDDGIEYDLTISQFGPDPIFEDPIEERERVYVLGFPETYRRYRLLMQRMADYAATERVVRES